MFSDREMSAGCLVSLSVNTSVESQKEEKPNVRNLF